MRNSTDDTERDPILPRAGSSLLILPSSFLWEPAMPYEWCFWSLKRDYSFKDHRNLAISFGASGCDEPDLSLQYSDNKFLLAATEPDKFDNSAPVETSEASSRFLLAFAKEAGWTNGPECEALWCWCSFRLILNSAACDGLGGSIGKPEAISSGWGLNCSLRLLEFDWPCLFCEKKAISLIWQLNSSNTSNWTKKKEEDKWRKV